MTDYSPSLFKKWSPHPSRSILVCHRGLLCERCLFLFLKDICEVCSSAISLYADDAKLYRRIKTINAALIFERDLDYFHGIRILM